MSVVIAAILATLLLGGASLFPIKPPTGGAAGIRIDDNGRAGAAAAATASTTDAGVRIDPEGRTRF